MTRADFQVPYDQGSDALYALIPLMERTIAALSATVQVPEQQVAAFTARAHGSEDQPRKDSHNSHKHPNAVTRSRLSSYEISGNLRASVVCSKRQRTR